MTMKQITPFLLVTAFSAYSQSKPPKQEANVPAVEKLSANPERLKELHRRSKTEHPTMGNTLCMRV